MVLGGAFASINGQPVRNIGSWDGTTITELTGPASGLFNNVYALEEYNGLLIAAIRSSTNFGTIEAWDGAAWTSMFWNAPGQVYALLEHNGELFAGGSEGHVRRWTGSFWEPIGDPLFGRVQALAVHDEVLYAGTAPIPDQVLPNDYRLAYWTGNSWQQVGDGLNGSVSVLLSDPTGLLVGGRFDATADDLQLLGAAARWAGGVFTAIPISNETAVHSITRTSDGLLAVGGEYRLHIGNEIFHQVPFTSARTVFELNGGRYVAGQSNEGDSYAPCRGIARLLPGTNAALLDVNDIRAMITPSPHSFDPWWTERYRFEVPKGHGVNGVYASSPWLLAWNDGGRYGSVPGYTQPESFNSERVWAGPLAVVMDSVFVSKYHRVWKLDRAQVQSHIAGWNDQGYVMPESIASWPGNGDLGNGEPARLAPFADLNGNGLYEPAEGEYPLIKGDQAIYAITHTTEQGSFFSDTLSALPFDLHIMHYAFEGTDDPALAQTIFVNYQYVNRSEQTFTDIRFGQFADIDIGNPDDDFAGCDSTRNMFFVYNWDDLDESTSLPSYGSQPPAVGVKFLEVPMLSHRIWLRESPAMISLNDMMYGLRSGEPFDELGYPTHYQYPGGSFIEEVPTLATPDRTAVGATGPFTMGPGDTLCMDLAFIYARASSGGAYASVEALKLRADSVQASYDGFGIGCGSYPSMVSVPTVELEERVRLFPNPASAQITVESDTRMEAMDLLDVHGRVVRTVADRGTLHHVDLRGLPAGTYVVRVRTAQLVHVHRLVVQ